MEKKRVLVSACLLGVRCRYNGECVAHPQVAEAAVKYGWIPVCPEILGGLSTPRLPCERLNGKVVNRSGEDVTEAFEEGARQVLNIAKLYGIDTAVLKERSPSCGCGVIYDGTFTSTRIAGDGVTAELLKANGIRVFGESEIEKLMQVLSKSAC